MKRPMNGMRSGWQAVHPALSFLYYAGLGLLVLLSFHPVIAAGILALSVLFNVLVGLGRRTWKTLAWCLAAGVVIVAVNMLTNHRGRHVLFVWPDQPVTLEALLYGAQNALMLICVLLVILSYAHVVSPQKWLYLFSRPFPKLSLMISLSVRFVPLLLRRLAEISDVHRMRGIAVTEGTVRERAESAMKQLQALLSWSLEEAVQTADSMLARGYGAVRRRGTYHPYRWTRRDTMLAVVLGVWLAASIGCWVYGAGRLDIYPVMEPLAPTAQDAAAALAVWFYACVPVLVEERERWRWRSWKSEM
jgi:energy-coupling factor transport system permease protein